MKYAVIQTGGKQYRVSEGDVLEVEHVASDNGQKITFAEVLLYAGDDGAKVGTPFVDGISVGAVVVEHVKGEKIRVAKFKAKARHRRVTGHRQSLTRIKIEAIHDGKPKKESASAAKATEEVAATVQNAEEKPVKRAVKAKKA